MVKQRFGLVPNSAKLAPLSSALNRKRQFSVLLSAAVEGYRIRRPTSGDFTAVVELIRDCQRADKGAATIVEELYAVSWKDLDLEHDAWLAVDRDERLVGLVTLKPYSDSTRIIAGFSVHPNHRDRGIDAELELRLQVRARELVSAAPPTSRVTLVQSVDQFESFAPPRLTANGYALARRFWEMAIDLGDEPRPVTWPSGIRVACVERGQERAFFDAMNEAFQDHWGFLPVPFEQAMKYLDRPGADDRSISFIAWDGNELAGCCYNFVPRPGKGYVATLGVRRPWRRRGLGLALLVHSFNEFRRRGLREAALNVDSDSPTGATRLYERAGMHVVSYSDRYEKILREATPAPA